MLGFWLFIDLGAELQVNYNCWSNKLENFTTFISNILNHYIAWSIIQQYNLFVALFILFTL